MRRTQASRFRTWLGLGVALVGLALPRAASADDWDDDETDPTKTKTTLSGFVRSDVRYAIPFMNPWWCTKSVTKGWCHGGQTVRDVKPGFIRNENAARVRFAVTSGDLKYKAIAEFDFVWVGFQRKIDDLGGLVLRENLDPFRIEAHALYFRMNDFILKGMDITIGRQIVQWGKADQFNPTSNINGLDLEDPLLFGDRLANNMIKIDYTPRKLKHWTFTLVWVPIFRPWQLNATAPLGPKSVDRIPVHEDHVRRNLHVERDFFANIFRAPTIVTRATPSEPELDIRNSQVALKVTGKIKKIDLSLSYYYGRNGLPTPSVNRTFNEGDHIDAQATLVYPKMHVLGFDLAGQIPLGKVGGGGRGIGWWVEMGIFFPQSVTFAIYQNRFPIVPNGEYDYEWDGVQGGKRPQTVNDRAFAKFVVGLDYSFNRHVYMNVQWIHGFVDEFGAGDWFHKGFIPMRGFTDLDVNNDGNPDLDQFTHCQPPAAPSPGTPARHGEICAKEYLRSRQGDYLVAGFDFKFYREQMLIRLFFILDLSGMFIDEFHAANATPAGLAAGQRRRKYLHAFHHQAFSAVIFPSWTWSVGKGAEISLGAFWMFGRKHTKFGDPAAGGSVIFGKGKFSF